MPLPISCLLALASIRARAYWVYGKAQYQRILRFCACRMCQKYLLVMDYRRRYCLTFPARKKGINMNF
jgi:hypothetical protein